MAGSEYRVDRPTAVEPFLARAFDFLVAHEAENNLIIGLAETLRERPLLYGIPARYAVVTRGAEIAGAALQTPPYNLVLAYGTELEAVDALVESFASDPLPGVNGEVELSTRFAERWRERTGQAIERGLTERAFRLTRVRWPRSTTGRMRAAEEGDRPLLVDWLVAFAREALDERAYDAEGWVQRAMEAGTRRIYLWEDAGRAVSFLSAGSPTPHGIRIGPVYTPPDRRGRGYASNLVAQATAAELDRGRRFVFLFTDLANPTSNKIYQAIGYEPVLDVQLYRFGEPAS